MSFIEKIFSKQLVKDDPAMTIPELDPQRKICYPGYHRYCEFASLQEAARVALENGRSLKNMIAGIIMYNICYRDYLRDHGIGMLLKRIVMDVPDLGKDQDFIQCVSEWYDKTGRNLSGYDIQCYAIKDTVTILGQEFQGLDDVMAHRSACGRIGCSDITLNECNPVKKSPGLYVSEFYSGYPVFDSYDIGDDRTYQNYIFTRRPIDDEMLAQISEIRHNHDYCMVHEEIPEHFLPVLYYRGVGDYMILATKK